MTMTSGAAHHLHVKRPHRPPRQVHGSLPIWALLLSLIATPAMGAVTGSCSSCHTMHYSQGGQVLTEWGDQGPYFALLTTDCGGCHMGINDGGKIPFVMSPGEPIYGFYGAEAGTNTLAGGSFFWVAQGGSDSKGHNAKGFSAPDATLDTPPGFTGNEAAADGSLPGGGHWPNGQQVTCAGTYGCHGSHATPVAAAAIRGAHHQGRSGAHSNPGPTPAEGYRMLVGIAGYEDPAWEFSPTRSTHNQYKGADGTRDNSTMSSLCMRCHGNFHAGQSGGSWLKHPIEFDLSNTSGDSEVRFYGGANHDYQLEAPVASYDVAEPLANVTLQGSDAIVSCISCHRSHGSPFDKMMRFNYAGTLGDGCIVCHTSKD